MIESEVFRSIIHKYLVDYGFIKTGANYVLSFPELNIALGLQKSGYSDGYYINLGYIFTDIGFSKNSPRAVDGDIRTRFSVEFKGKNNDLFELERLSEDILLASLQMNIEKYVSGICNIDTIQGLLKREPVLLYQTSFNAKQFLEFRT